MTRVLLGVVGMTVLAGACGGTAPKAVSPDKQAKIRITTVREAEGCGRKHAGTGAARADTRRQGGTLALAKGEGRTIAYIADTDDDSLLTMDVDSGATLSRTPLPGSPSQVMVLADGRVAVAVRDKNRVEMFEPAALDQPLEKLCSVATAVEPYGLAATPDDKRVVVTSGFGHRLAAYEAADMHRVLDKKLAREPRSVLVDEDGKRAFVAHVVGGKVSVVDLEGGDEPAREIDLRVDKGSAFGGAGPRQSCQGFALARSVTVEPDKTPIPFNPEQPPHLSVAQPKPRPVPAAPKGRVFAPRVTIDPGDPTRFSSGYGNSPFGRMEQPIVSVIDSGAERALTTASTDASVTNGGLTKGECLLPRAAAVAQNGVLFVSCLGTDAVVEMDSRGVDPSGLEHRRWHVPAGPTGLAIDDAGSRVVVWSQFDRKLAVVDLERDAVDSFEAPAVVKAKLSPLAALGRKVFHRTDDARISRDGRACASCHPDGREDALTWPTPVGPRQTLMLAGRVAGTAPYSWLGAHENLKVHLHNTFERLGGTGLPDEANVNDELDALVAYLTEMPAPNMDGAAPNGNPELVAHGKDLFFSAEQGCASCHVGGNGTDAKPHDLSTQASADTSNSFDTPSLHFVSGTAPYFHDGRYATLLDLLTSTDSRMGHTMHLSRRDALALDAYLETL